MIVESFFVLLCKSLDFARHNVHFRSLWRSLFLMYQGALAMFRSTLSWNRCIMSILLCLAQPQSWVPYVQTGFIVFVQTLYEMFVILISNFCHVLNVVCFLLGDSPASEIYMPNFRHWGITQKKAYKMLFVTYQL